MELKAFVEKCRDEGHFTEIFNSGNGESLRSCGGAKDTNVAILLSHNYDRKAANDQFTSENSALQAINILLLVKENPEFRAGARYLNIQLP